MVYQSSSLGTEISCVLYNINAEILNNHRRLEQILLEALTRDNFKILGKLSHEFQPQGYTCVVLLAESHAAIHTFPEHNSLVFYLYSCRGRDDGWKTFEYLKQILNPSHIDLDVSERQIVLKDTRPGH